MTIYLPNVFWSVLEPQKTKQHGTHITKLSIHNLVGFTVLVRHKIINEQKKSNNTDTWMFLASHDHKLTRVIWLIVYEGAITFSNEPN